MPFARLLSVATLTPAQASLVAVQLLDAAGMRDPGDDQSSAWLGAVTLTPSGGVDVSRPPADAGTPVTELLNQLLHTARRLPGHPRPEQLLLLRSLEEAAREPLLAPGARARELEDALVETLGAGAPKRLAGQLAALVDALAHVAPGVPDGVGTVAAPAAEGVTSARAATPSTTPAPGPSRPGPLRATPVNTPSRSSRRGRSLTHRRTRGRRVALVFLVLAAVLAGSGYVALSGPGAGIVESLGRGNQPAAPDTAIPAQPSKPPNKEPAPDRAPAVSTMAPRKAGPITGVTLQTAGSCEPGARCPVTVTVRFRAASTTRTVGWKVGAARLCTRGTTWSPPVTVTAQPGWTTVYASSTVRVPRGRSLALVAVTTTPARAQSRPAPVTGSSLDC